MNVFIGALVIGLLVPVVLAVCLVLLVLHIRKKQKEDYFNRMYWVVRKAQEDAQKDKTKND